MLISYKPFYWVMRPEGKECSCFFPRLHPAQGKDVSNKKVLKIILSVTMCLRSTMLLGFQGSMWILFISQSWVFEIFSRKKQQDLTELYRNNYIADIHSGKTKIYYNGSIHISYTGLEEVWGKTTMVTEIKQPLHFACELSH